jgi:hypothetical protein
MTPWEHAPPFPEWAELQPSQPVRQGDVLSAIGQEDRWHELLVVLTADCDLARSKHGGALSCVPLLSHTDYLLIFKYENLRDSVSGRLIKQLLETYTNGTILAEPPRISHSRMGEWITEVDIASIISALKLEGQSASQFAELAEVVRRLTTATPGSITVASQLLAEAKHLLGDVKTFEKAITSVAAEFASTLRTLPGDALFLNQVSPEHTYGYVAYLRRIIEVTDNLVVRSASRIPHDARYLRISRLRSPYIYALSQQFASVFSAIGLPTEYEIARGSTLERLRNLEA